MSAVRRLQYIGKQHLLNIPASLVREFGWRRGDYIEVVGLGKQSVGFSRIAEHDEPRVDAVLASLDAEAQGLFALIRSAGVDMNPARFCWYQARLSNITAKMRRLRMGAEMKTGYDGRVLMQT